MRAWPAGAALATLILMPPASAAAQGMAVGSLAGSQPIEIQARDALEWDRDGKRYVARGEARAIQGATSVDAETLTAHYREQPNQGTQIFRLEATGKVRIATATEQAVADRAIYDIDTKVLVLTGDNLKLTATNLTVTARDSLEYWEVKQMMVARGDALVVSEDKRLKADVVTAYFADAAAKPGEAAAKPAAPAPASTAKALGGMVPAGGSQRLQRVEGFGGVMVSTPTDIARAERGVYNAQTGVATLAGAVKLTRGQSQLNGEYAEINLNTGVSRLLSQPGETSGRVRGLIAPQDRPKGPATQPSPPAN